jgi:hypothetical protein
LKLHEANSLTMPAASPVLSSLPSCNVCGLVVGDKASLAKHQIEVRFSGFGAEDPQQQKKIVCLDTRICQIAGHFKYNK